VRRKNFFGYFSADAADSTPRTARFSISSCHLPAFLFYGLRSMTQEASERSLVGSFFFNGFNPEAEREIFALGIA
jgi:hypothetical protein